MFRLSAADLVLDSLESSSYGQRSQRLIQFIGSLMIKNFVVHFENLVKGQPAGYIGMFFRAYLGESGKNVESVQSCRDRIP